jgi:hypothetical protein
VKNHWRIAREYQSGPLPAVVPLATRYSGSSSSVIAVVDDGGNLVGFSRMDGAQITSVQIAIDKAKAAGAIGASGGMPGHDGVTAKAGADGLAG